MPCRAGVDGFQINQVAGAIRAASTRLLSEADAGSLVARRRAGTD
jgi:hypothetical protein